MNSFSIKTLRKGFFQLIGFHPKGCEQKPPSALARDAKVLLGSGQIILIIDDDDVVLTATSMKLRSAGYRVLTARDASEAISAVGQSRPNLILLDINFPPDVASGGCVSWDGFGIMTWLRCSPNLKGVPFVIISGENSDELRKRSLKAGAAGFFAKPIELERVLALLKDTSATPASMP
jgi:CheY-like chemotaxis protein